MKGAIVLVTLVWASQIAQGLDGSGGGVCEVSQQWRGVTNMPGLQEWLDGQNTKINSKLSCARNDSCPGECSCRGDAAGCSVTRITLQAVIAADCTDNCTAYWARYVIVVKNCSSEADAATTTVPECRTYCHRMDDVTMDSHVTRMQPHDVSKLPQHLDLLVGLWINYLDAYKAYASAKRLNSTTGATCHGVPANHSADAVMDDFLANGAENYTGGEVPGCVRAGGGDRRDEGGVVDRDGVSRADDCMNPLLWLLIVSALFNTFLFYYYSFWRVG